MKKLIINATLLFATTAVLITACKKKKDDDSTPDYSVTSETNSSQDDWDDILKVSEAALRDQSQYKTSGGCPTISLGSNQVTIDYGSSCAGGDGRIRKGILVVDYTVTHPYTTDGAVITITTNNYYVNGKKIEGRRTVTNNGTSSGKLKFTIKDSGEDGTGYSKITQTDGGVATWKSTRTRVWDSGSPDANIYDDVLIINGTAEGTSSKGVAYTMVATDIKLKSACWLAYIYAPVSGTLSLTAADGTRSVDYGTGICDRTVTYTHTNGKTYTITWY